MVLPPDTDDGLGALILNSNAETHFSFSNALGMISVEQSALCPCGDQAIPPRAVDRGTSSPLDGVPDACRSLLRSGSGRR